MNENQEFQENENELNQQTNEEVNEHTAEAGQAGETASEDASEGAAAEKEGFDPAALKSEVERLKGLADDYQQRAIRTQADFDNFRKRTQKEKEDLAKYASSKLVAELLPVVDNFERALAAAGEGSEMESFTKGVSMIFRQLEGVLQSEGLLAMVTVGEPFNPEYHQAIMQVESDEYEEGIVVEEVQKGYMLKDKVLRPAMVKVSM
ncbi:nucleotide exchange factor GrpE [Paenibacillus sp. XY044]|uniref:nucleotide exchange factor GrpE n=1 Tax=Paenibacillus sp. XY044 TaxID=2026089 RepID=UPI000B988788|nr:nucleotide exchange factor GrpE [Paenibacillus sp. XY044]OZB91650.1 nucleotide exchange factor GrpE [Paenibacillus sp. XY044]